MTRLRRRQIAVLALRDKSIMAGLMPRQIAGAEPQRVEWQRIMQPVQVCL